jgi:hypothetical protein
VVAQPAKATAARTSNSRNAQRELEINHLMRQDGRE